MTFQTVYGATVVVFVLGVVTLEPAYAQRRDGSLLPQEQSGQVTAVGCLVPGSAVKGGKDDFVLASPKQGPVTSVPDGKCSVDSGADALQLDLETEVKGTVPSMVGKWVELSGRLERETSDDPDDLRELDVMSAKLVPVVPPKVAAAPAPAPAPRPTPRPEPAPAPAPAPAPTMGEAPPPTLPKTASQLPAVGLFGLLSMAGGLVLRSFRLRQRG